MLPKNDALITKKIDDPDRVVSRKDAPISYFVGPRLDDCRSCRKLLPEQETRRRVDVAPLQEAASRQPVKRVLGGERPELIRRSPYWKDQVQLAVDKQPTLVGARPTLLPCDFSVPSEAIP